MSEAAENTKLIELDRIYGQKSNMSRFIIKKKVAPGSEISVIVYSLLKYAFTRLQ